MFQFHFSDSLAFINRKRVGVRVDCETVLRRYLELTGAKCIARYIFINIQTLRKIINISPSPHKQVVRIFSENLFSFSGINMFEIE